MNLTSLGDILGNRSAEAALLHLFHYGETYGRAISNDLNLSLEPIQRQLEKFRLAGVLVSKKQGRTLIYTWNPKSRAASRLKDLVEVCYQSIPQERRTELFSTRRRPRAKDKPTN